MAEFSRGFPSWILSTSYMITEMELDYENDMKLEWEWEYELFMSAMWELDNDDDIDFEEDNAEREADYIIFEEDNAEREKDYIITEEDYIIFEEDNAEREKDYIITEEDYIIFEEDNAEREKDYADFMDNDEYMEMEARIEYEEEASFYYDYIAFKDEHEERYYDEVMDFENKHEGFTEDDMDVEAELEERLEHETALLALLRSQNLIVYNSDGTLRCPLCPSRKTQAYSYKDLLHHATAVASGKLGPEAAGKHSALKTFLEPKLLSQRFLYVEQNLPPRRQAEDMLVCPWSVVIYNIDKSILDWTRPETCDRLRKSKLKLYFADFNPVQLEVYQGSQYKPGACVLEFGRDLSGLKDAQALERSFIDQEHGLRDCERRLDSKDLGENFYGSLAREADYNGRRCGLRGEEIGKYLRKEGNLKDIEMVGDELKSMHDQQVRQLAATVSEKSKESQDLKTEMEKIRRRAEAERLQLEESHKLESEEVRVKARISEEQYNQANLETTRDLEKREAEFRQLGKTLREKESHITSAAEKNRLQAQMLKEETLKLVEHARKEALKLAKRQQIEMEREQLQTMLETEKLIKDDFGNESKKMEELEKKLAELQSTEEYQEETITTLAVKERESNDELVDGREMAVQVIQYINEAKRLIEAALKKKGQLDKTKPQEVNFKQPQPTVEVKRAGAIDKTSWPRAFKRKYKSDGDWGMKMTEVFSSWEARIRNPEFQPFKTVQIREDKWEVISSHLPCPCPPHAEVFFKQVQSATKQQIDDENEELASLKKTHGKEVFNSVTAALMEIEEYNASGRYPVPVAWNFKKSNASVKEVIQYLGRIIDSLVAPEVLAHLGRTIESLMGPGASRKRSRN